MLLNELQEYCEISNIKEMKDWYFYSNKTPTFIFTHYLNFSLIEGYIIKVSIRGVLEVKVIYEFLMSIEKFINTDCTNRIVKIENIAYKETKFDAMLFIPSQYHTSFSTFSDKLYQKTIDVFPIYGCEFSGDESPDIVKLLRQNFVSTINWKREISPKIKLRFKNNKTKSGTIGKKLYLDKWSNLLHELNNLQECTDSSSFIEVENYKNEYIHISILNNKVMVIRNKNEILLQGKLKDIKRYVSNFIFN
ncbi:hypothetical protein [Lysinibacillus sp. NPDC056185]|uniref:hypothetical protein n=1 Tax=Lysinibacillus sp. NPDC056185 TaxID=3345739 RepID=UPI0039F13571